MNSAKRAVATQRRQEIEACDHSSGVETRDQIMICTKCGAFLGYDL